MNRPAQPSTPYSGKTVFLSHTYPIDIIDTNTEVKVKGAKGRMSVVTDSTTSGEVVSIRLVMYPYVALLNTKNETDHLRCVESYAKCLTSIMAGDIVVYNTPFPTVLNMITHVELGMQEDDRKPLPNAQDGIATYGPHITTFLFNADETEQPGNPKPVQSNSLGIYVPEASDFAVEINPAPIHQSQAIKNKWDQGRESITWPGLLQILQKYTTRLIGIM